MTGPNISATTQAPGDDPRVLNNIQALRKANWDDVKIRQYLHGVGVNPDEYLASGGGAGGFTRGLALYGGRGGLQGLGGLADVIMMPFNAPQRIAATLTGTPPPPSMREAAVGAADAMGLPDAETRGERIGLAAAEAVATGLPLGGAPGVGRGLFNAAVAAGAGANAQRAKENGAGMLGQLGASLVVGGGVPMLSILGPAAIRAAFRGVAARQAAAEQKLALLQAGNPGAAVTLGQVAEGGLLGGGRTLQRMIRGMPGASDKIAASADRQAIEMGERADALATRLGPARDPSVVGRVIQRGIDEGFIPRFRATSDMLYDRVWQLVPETTLVQPANVVNVFVRQGNLAAAARPFSENLGHPVLKQWGEDLATTLAQSPNGIPLSVLKAWRSKLGDWQHGRNAIEGMDLGDVKQLYTAVSDDIEAAILKTGNQQALRHWNRAKDFYRYGMERIENVLQPLLDKKVPELAFHAVLRGGKDGATVIRSTMRSITPPQRRLVAGTVLRNLGKARAYQQDAAGDVFNPETFLTRWNSLEKSARRALFEGIDPRFTKDLDALAAATAVRRQSARLLPGPAGSASHPVALVLLSALTASGGFALSGNMKGAVSTMASTGALLGTSDLAARVLTSPRMVRWMVRQTKVPAGAVKQELALLAKQTEEWEPEDRMVAQDFLSTVKDADWHRLLLDSLVREAAAPGTAADVTGAAQ